MVGKTNLARHGKTLRGTFLNLASVFNNIKSILSILNNYDANKKFVILELKKFIYLYNLINRNKKLLENFKKF